MTVSVRVVVIRMKATAAPKGQLLSWNWPIDERRHHLELRPAQQHRRRIGVHREDEGQDGAGEDAGQGQRPEHAA